MIRLFLLLTVTCLMLSGCGQDTSKRTPATKKQPSTAQQALEGVTGKTAVDTGERAKDKIRQISAEEQAERDAVLNAQ